MIATSAPRGPKQRARHEGAFTLLEVLIAIALLGLALVPLLGTFSQSMRMAESSKRLTQATLIAREMMTLMDLQEFPELGESKDDFNIEERPELEAFRWRRQVLPPPAGLDEETVREVRLEILWDEGTVERGYEVINFVVRR